jgi:hypothetical protein
LSQSEVGIFWLIGGKVVLDTSPVNDAEDYADCKTHGLSHQEYWEHLVKLGAIPDGDYEEHPRGRVVYNTTTRQFTMYADQCILRNRTVVRQIVDKMHLPSSTAMSTDNHYLCFNCLRSPAVDEP